MVEKYKTNLGIMKFHQRGIEILFHEIGTIYYM